MHSEAELTTMHSKLPTLAFMQAYYGSFKLLALEDDRPWMQMPVQLGGLDSGERFQITCGELGLLLSLSLLLLDLARAYSKRERALGQHLVMFVLFVCSLVQFIKVPGYYNPSFLMYVLTVLCGLTAGMLIMLASRRELYPRS